MSLRFLLLAEPTAPLAASQLDAVLSYMDKAEMILPSTEYSPDPFDEHADPVGPLLFYSDGTWVFSTEHYEYIRRGHRVPEREFLQLALAKRDSELIESGVSREDLFAFFDTL